MTNQRFNLDIPRMGYFLVYKNQGGFFGNRIVNAQKDEGFSQEDAEFVHVEPSLGGQYSINARIPFSKPIDITEVHEGRYVKIVRPRLPQYDLRRYKVAVWCATRCNIPYGIFGVLWFKMKGIFKKNVFSAIGDFCSELSAFGIWREYGYNEDLPTVVNLYTQMIPGEQFLPKKPNETMPADFLNPKYFEVVWEGFLPGGK